MITKYEMETIINYNREEPTANIYTHDAKMIKKITMLCEKHPDDFKFIKSDGDASFFEINKKYICINAPKKFSAEVRQQYADRINQYNKISTDTVGA
jgi:hypothetical protein